MTVVASNFERRENDLYRTEAWATDALLRHFPVTGLDVWEPAAGGHDMADVLKRHGASEVWTSDVAAYDRDHDEIFDFLQVDCGRLGFDAIITNPPYGKGNRDAVKFAELALKRCAGVVALLLTAKFDSGKTRVHLFRDNPRFIAKIALLDRIQWFPGDSTGTEDHAWYVWTATHNAGLFRPTLRYEGRGGTVVAEEAKNDPAAESKPFLIKPFVLRPHCLAPELCASGTRDHCNRCKKAMAESEAA